MTSCSETHADNINAAALTPLWASAREALQMALLLSEKCELGKAAQVYESALKMAQAASDNESIVEALNGLFRLSSEAIDEPAMRKWESEIDRFIDSNDGVCPPMTWFCKGAVARHRDQHRVAQYNFHRFLRDVRSAKELDLAGRNLTRDDLIARGWLMLAAVSHSRGNFRRAVFIVHEILRRYESQNLRTVNGTAYMALALVAEVQRDFKTALQWLQKAQVSTLADHNWYYHLYVLKAYARIARLQQDYALAYWYLDLVDKIATGPAFNFLRKQTSIERSKLQMDAVDLLIDSRKGIVRTRGSKITLRKQYVLLGILEALSDAHGRTDGESQRGLSKGEIIKHVWGENYRPEAHDNKLYYNINRLRKLIEPDMKQPQYLLNWKEGYRLAPGLRVQFIKTR